MGVSIKSIGIYVPSHVVTNEDLEKTLILPMNGLLQELV
jgi:hypothetical protein